MLLQLQFTPAILDVIISTATASGLRYLIIDIGTAINVSVRSINKFLIICIVCHPDDVGMVS